MFVTYYKVAYISIMFFNENDTNKALSISSYDVLIAFYIDMADYVHRMEANDQTGDEARFALRMSKHNRDKASKELLTRINELN